MKIELVCNPQCLLGEGPYWHAADQKLYFTDINNGCIWQCDTTNGITQQIWTDDFKIGAFAFNQTDDLIMFAEDKVLKLHADSTLELLFKMDFQPGQIFNDITVDPKGRIFAGTVTHPKGDDALFLFEQGQQPVVLAEDLSCSNGLAFSMDEAHLFHVDTRHYRILKYDYDKSTGQISNRQTFFQSNHSMGLPDGMTIDTDDCLWVAFWDGAAIRKISPNGQIIDHIPLPCQRPTSLTFGGEKLDELFITSAAENNPNSTKQSPGGAIYKIRTQSTGRKEWPANL